LQRKGGTDPVRADYQEIKLLRQLCQRHKIGILLVHHSRKAARGDDIGSLDQILGTTGVSAAVDSILLLATNNDGQRLMIVTGKDCALEDNQAMTFDPKASPPWSCQGSAFWLTVGMERTDVLTLLVSGPKQLGTLVTALGKKKAAVSNMLTRMAQAGLLFKDPKGWALRPHVAKLLAEKQDPDVLDYDALKDEAVRAQDQEETEKYGRPLM